MNNEEDRYMYNHLLDRLYEKVKDYIRILEKEKELTDQDKGFINGLYVMLDTVRNTDWTYSVDNEVKTTNKNINEMVDYIEEKYILKNDNNKKTKRR